MCNQDHSERLFERDFMRDQNKQSAVQGVSNETRSGSPTSTA